ncbi:bacterial alpha-L-rhamnosidase domain-containing protein [Emericellopsis cladophorae]|uniref:Bacterial alpha-L-rhamnosidase domain-containing protein n=1 Tax=Emericellopsis cladophorae TaxID=2686198 RepID=A0A9P9Y8N8_9HYPO|nr:bacterial alpha-L-rhamnosidase domain-containing protein [Emericellopsis cladophorae]KAI6785516.1 bacterial alpha-L-rhamnosidase domain-containing protein [Emericellopsis cladophorae]
MVPVMDQVNVVSFPDGEFVSAYDENAKWTLNSETPEIVLDFGCEVGGIISLDYDQLGEGPSALALAFTEAKNYISHESDSSNGSPEYPDLHLKHKINSTGPGTYTMPDASLRGGFRYLTLYQEEDGAAPLHIRNVRLEISFQPTWPDMRAYQGYFYSEDELLNRIWYSGAYTLQTNSVPSNTGRVDVGTIEEGWKNDAFVGPGGTVLLDGAKRDRWVWIGDMGTAVPSAFVSTGDMASTRNALQVMFDNLRDDDVLPKAGPPYLAYNSDTYHMWTMIGVYNYVLYTDDIDWLKPIWPKYIRALNYARGLVNDKGIVSVKGTADWARWLYSSERSSASVLLYRALQTGAEIGTWYPDLPDASSLAEQWTKEAETLREAIMAELWDETTGAFRESPDDVSLFPQDANSMSLAFDVLERGSEEAERVSSYLESNWTPIGPEVPELLGNISPFITSIEIFGHFRAGHPERAVQLMRDAWGWYINHPNGTGSTVAEGYRVNGTWGYRIDRGYKDETYMSHAHCWSSGPTSSLTERLVGLQVTAPAGEEWQFIPETGVHGLGEAEAGFTTKLGKFSASFKVDGNRVHIKWDTPEETRGWLSLPGKSGRWIDGGKGSKTICL